MTIEEFSRKIGISRIMFTKVLAGTRNCNYSNARAIAQALETPVGMWMRDGEETGRRREAWNARKNFQQT